MPVPTFTGLGPDATKEEIVNKVNVIVKELRNLLLSLDDANFTKITAKVMEVDQLSAISANLGEVTAGKVTGALIQNQVAEGNRVYVDAQGFHSKDAAGVERITIGTTPAKGAKALITRNSAGVEQGVYTYDTETVDGASRTGQFITAHGSYFLIDTSGNIRMQTDPISGEGFRAVKLSRPEINDGAGWSAIAKKSEADARGFTMGFDSPTKVVTLYDKNLNVLSTVTLSFTTSSASDHNHGITPGRYLKTYDSAGVELGLQVWSASGGHSHSI